MLRIESLRHLAPVVGRRVGEPRSLRRSPRPPPDEHRLLRMCYSPPPRSKSIEPRRPDVSMGAATESLPGDRAASSIAVRAGGYPQRVCLRQDAARRVRHHSPKLSRAAAGRTPRSSAPQGVVGERERVTPMAGGHSRCRELLLLRFQTIFFEGGAGHHQRSTTVRPGRARGLEAGADVEALRNGGLLPGRKEKTHRAFLGPWRPARGCRASIPIVRPAPARRPGSGGVAACAS